MRLPTANEIVVKEEVETMRRVGKAKRGSRMLNWPGNLDTKRF